MVASISNRMSHSYNSIYCNYYTMFIITHREIAQMKHNGENYYSSIYRKMMREFNAMYASTGKALEKHYSISDIQEFQKASRAEYLRLFPQLPYIGGKKNSETINVIMGAIILSIVRPLENKGLTVNQIGEIIFLTFKGYFEARPFILRSVIGRLISSKLFVKLKMKQIENYSRHKYENNFVMEIVETSDTEFDFGYNYTRCVLHRLFMDNNAAKYLPYVCLGDHALFRSLGIGFHRTQTIANGAPLCDFRFKKEMTSSKGWPPEELDEWIVPS